MNFLEGEIGERNGQPVIHLGVGGALTSLPLAERRREIAQQAGRRVVLGIRPETLVEASRARPEPGRPLASLDAVVEVVAVVEPTGSETMVIVRLGDRDVVARFEADAAPAARDRVTLAVDMGKACLFDPDTQLLI